MRDPMSGVNVVLVPHLRRADGSLVPIPQGNGPGVESVRRGPDDAFSSGSVGFGFTGSLIIPDASGQPVRHTFSANAVEPKTAGIGKPRESAPAKPKADKAAAARQRYGTDTAE